jgi:uncharacterized membrane protein
LALVLAQIPVIHQLKGGQVLGLFCIYLFLAVIGAFCEFASLIQMGSLAWKLLFFGKHNCCDSWVVDDLRGYIGKI